MSRRRTGGTATSERRPRPRAGAVARLARGNTFQNFTHSEEKYNQSCFFCRINEQCADGSYRHQAFNGEGLSHPQSCKRSTCDGGNSDQAGSDKCPIADLWYDQFHTPGDNQKQGGKDHQFTLGSLIPAFAPIRRIVMNVAGATVAGIVRCFADCL